MSQQITFKDGKACTILFILFFIICLIPGVPSWLALVLGFVFSCFNLVPTSVSIGKITKSLLSYSIVGLGFGLTLTQAKEACENGLTLIIGSIIITIFCGVLLSKLLKIEKKTGLLISSGTAICGGSAIAAVAPAIEAEDDQTSIALATVFTLNAVALVLFPLIGHLLNMSDMQFGLWSAIAIHDTSSVVGASASYSENALQIATTVKLARALFIVPVALIATLIYTRKSKHIRVPNFIPLYILAVLICSFVKFQIGDFITSDQVYPFIYEIAKRTIVGALFFIGASISIKKFKQTGPRALILGITLWVIISCASLSIILNYY
ncbi:MAG: YeiH family protein [Succinivibrionaceae bacterium]